MSQIPFVNVLGDALESAASREAARSPRRLASGWGRVRRMRFPPADVLRRHPRAGALLAALAIGGGAVAVAATLQNSTALVAGGIVCYGGTGTGGSVPMYANVEANGRSPEAACAQVFRADGPAALGRPGVKLTACADSHGFVAVFKANGAAGQCRAAGMSPLQARSYAVAQVSVDRLVRRLSALNPNRACIAPARLVGEVQRVLQRSGWSGWRAELQTHPEASGQCGLFLGTGSSFSDPTASLDAHHHVVWVTAGPIPSLMASTGPLDYKLLKVSGRHCYTPAGARAVVRSALSSAHAEIRFALTQEPKGGGWAYAQSAYGHGCTIVASLTPASYGRAVDAWLNSKSGAPEPGGWVPPASQYKPSPN